MWWRESPWSRRGRYPTGSPQPAGAHGVAATHGAAQVHGPSAAAHWPPSRRRQRWRDIPGAQGRGPTTCQVDSGGWLRTRARPETGGASRSWLARAAIASFGLTAVTSHAGVAATSGVAKARGVASMGRSLGPYATLAKYVFCFPRAIDHRCTDLSFFPMAVAPAKYVRALRLPSREMSGNLIRMHLQWRSDALAGGLFDAFGQSGRYIIGNRFCVGPPDWVQAWRNFRAPMRS